jgi:hypothetical protein
MSPPQDPPEPPPLSPRQVRIDWALSVGVKMVGIVGGAAAATQQILNMLT